MLLSEPLRQRLVNEFRFVASKMGESSTLSNKLYFFSAVFGETNRVMNQSWSADLALLHMVAQGLHKAANDRITAVPTDPTGIRGLPPEFPNALVKITLELADVFEAQIVDSGQLYNILTRMAELAYVCTGNGEYLHLKGLIKI